MMSDQPRPFLERLPLLGDLPLVAYAISLGMCAVAWWVRQTLDPVFPPGFPYVTFFPAVILSSFLFGRGPGTLAAVVCGLLAWWFFIPPDGFALATGTAIALVFYVFVVAVDILLVDWMQVANRRVRGERERSALLAERTELLFSELQHRVSNNLQMVGAVLTLQKRGVADPAARKALDDAAAKLHVIGRIQRQLYDTKGEQVALDAFLAQLAADVVAAGGKPGVTHRVDAAPGVMVPPDKLIPVALIMSEAIANAIEHGFAGRDRGHIDIAVRRDGGRLEISVRDDGAGLPPSFSAENTTSLGLRIARTLAAQLDAVFEVAPAPTGVVTRLALLLG